MERISTVGLVAVLMGLFSSAVSAPEGPFSREVVEDIDRFCGEVMACAHMPGLSLGIVRGEHTLATGHGVADLDTAAAVSSSTMFTLGSTAKAFVPYILAEIMNSKENKDGKLRWSSTLKEILLHYFDLKVPEPWASLTLRDVLIFKSGDSAADMSTMAGLPRTVSREELLRRLRFLPRQEDFEWSNHFSNYMYTVAAHIAEKFTGLGWEELVKAQVLDQQDMQTSTFTPQGLSQEEAALPYWRGPDTMDSKKQNASLFDIHPFEPVGSLMVSAKDITKWLRHLLHNLHYADDATNINLLIGDAFHQSVVEPAGERGGKLSHQSEVPLGYGMGWYSSNYRGLVRYSYSGGLYAYNSHIWLFPSANVAVYLAINGPGTEHAMKAAESIMYYVADVALLQTPWMEPTKACEGADYLYPDDYYYEDGGPQEVKAMTYLAPLEDYVGTFGNGIVGDLVVEASESGVLILRLGRNLHGVLSPGPLVDGLKLKVQGPLQITQEWHLDKDVEFLKREWAGSFGQVRLHLSENAFYDFFRDKNFTGMLLEPEVEAIQVTETTESFELQTSEPHSSSEETMNDDNRVVPRDKDRQTHQDDDKPSYQVEEREGSLQPVRDADQTRRHTTEPDGNGSSLCQMSVLSMVLTLILARLWA